MYKMILIMKIEWYGAGENPWKSYPEPEFWMRAGSSIYGVEIHVSSLSPSAQVCHFAECKAKIMTSIPQLVTCRFWFGPKTTEWLETVRMLPLSQPSLPRFWKRALHETRKTGDLITWRQWIQHDHHPMSPTKQWSVAGSCAAWATWRCRRSWPRAMP